MLYRWKPFDPTRNWPDLGERFIQGERTARKALREAELNATRATLPDLDATTSNARSVPQQEGADDFMWEDRVIDDKRDLDWAAVLKRTFESYIRGERPNLYGEWMAW